MLTPSCCCVDVGTPLIGNSNKCPKEQLALCSCNNWASQPASATGLHRHTVLNSISKCILFQRVQHNRLSPTLALSATAVASITHIQCPGFSGVVGCINRCSAANADNHRAKSCAHACRCIPIHHALGGLKLLQCAAAGQHMRKHNKHNKIQMAQQRTVSATVKWRPTPGVQW